MNNNCNSCAKFLTCNGNKCKKISFVQAGIVDKPKVTKRNCNDFSEFGISMQEAEELIIKAFKTFHM